MPAAFSFLSVANLFLYSSLGKGYTNVTFPVASVGNTGHLGLHGMMLWPLMNRWCLTWLELTRHGGVEVVGSLERFLIVFRALRLLCVRSSHLFLFSSVILSTSLVPPFMVVLSNGLLE